MTNEQPPNASKDVKEIVKAFKGGEKVVFEPTFNELLKFTNDAMEKENVLCASLIGRFLMETGLKPLQIVLIMNYEGTSVRFSVEKK